MKKFLDNRRVMFFSQNGPLPEQAFALLQSEGVLLEETRSLETLYKLLRERRYQLLLLRSDRLQEEHLVLLRHLKSQGGGVPVIMTLHEGTDEDARRALREGAMDVMVAAPDSSTLLKALRKTLVDNATASKPLADRPINEITLIGNSDAIRDVRSAIDLVADSRTAVLITGESGTGKEVVARSIHYRSNRADRPFVAVNCAALPRDVIENELFGHEQGSFTGATGKKVGCFDLADGGTLFFDEIAEMDPDTQAKLLRAIELKSFRRLGGSDEVKVDVRTIAATNKNIAAALTSGEFRQDLYYRFSVIEIALPSLRDRSEDLPLLVEHFLDEFSTKYGKPNPGISDSAMEFFVTFEWPGNVRQLRNVIERCVVTSTGRPIVPEDLPATVLQHRPAARTVTIPIGTTLIEAERTLIHHTLSALANNKSRAARVLGISRKTLHNKLNSYEAAAPALPEQKHPPGENE